MTGAGRLVGIYVTDAGGQPMRSVQAAEVAAGEGILGDRYALGTGEWSYDARLCSNVTLMATEVLDAVLADTGIDLRGGLSRRNFETVGVDLNALVGRDFRIGEVELHGDRPCDPCRYLDGVTGVSAMAALTGRGGLRATVLTGGPLCVGDSVRDEQRSRSAAG